MEAVEFGIFRQPLVLTVGFWFLLVVKIVEIHRILKMTVSPVEF